MKCFRNLLGTSELSKGYWQIKLNQKQRLKLESGYFNSDLCLFGLITAPATFSRLLRRVLSDMDNVDNFIDDILVYTMTFE